MHQLLLATHNAHKTREFSEILGEQFIVTDLSSIPGAPEINETGKTFVENATLKAITVARERDRLVIADDSGLEVDALGGAPGIFSARYAGPAATDQENIEKLLHALSNFEERTARFRCVIALARGSELLGTFEGSIEGTIVDFARGNLGFGYDPVFLPNGFEQTFGELSIEIKNRISHRGQAAEKLTRFLNTLPQSG